MELLGVIWLIIIPVAWLLFMLPSIIAFKRRHPNRWPILATNVFLGGSGIGWAGALTWALDAHYLPVEEDPPPSSGAHRHQSSSDDCPHEHMIEIAPTAVDLGEHTRLTLNEALEEIARLGQLKAAGHLNDDEFTALKVEIMQRM